MMKGETMEIIDGDNLEFTGKVLMKIFKEKSELSKNVLTVVVVGE